MGEPAIIALTARNDEDAPIVGTAEFTTPEKGSISPRWSVCSGAGPRKGSVEMPVSFFIDPDIMTDARWTT